MGGERNSGYYIHTIIMAKAHLDRQSVSAGPVSLSWKHVVHMYLCVHLSIIIYQYLQSIHHLSLLYLHSFIAYHLSSTVHLLSILYPSITHLSFTYNPYIDPLSTSINYLLSL